MPIRSGNGGQKNMKNLLGVGMRLYVKFGGNSCRNVRLMPGQADGQMNLF